MPCVPRAKINQINIWSIYLVKEGFKEAILSFQKIGLEPGVDVVMLDNMQIKIRGAVEFCACMQEAVAFQWSITTNLCVWQVHVSSSRWAP